MRDTAGRKNHYEEIILLLQKIIFDFASYLFSEFPYVRARNLRTDFGRWISRDPIGFRGGDWNLYGNVFNNPIANTDPTGLACGGFHFIVTPPTTTWKPQGELLICKDKGCHLPVNNLKTIISPRSKGCVDWAAQGCVFIEATFWCDTVEEAKKVKVWQEKRRFLPFPDKDWTPDDYNANEEGVTAYPFNYFRIERLNASGGSKCNARYSTRDCQGIRMWYKATQFQSDYRLFIGLTKPAKPQEVWGSDFGCKQVNGKDHVYWNFRKNLVGGP